MEYDYRVVVQNILGVVFDRNDGAVAEAVPEKDLELLVRFGIEAGKIGFSKGGLALRMFLSFGDGTLPRRRFIEHDEFALPQQCAGDAE